MVLDSKGKNLEYFLSRNDIAKIKMLNYHPHSNDLAEWVVQTNKSALKKRLKRLLPPFPLQLSKYAIINHRNISTHGNSLSFSLNTVGPDSRSYESDTWEGRDHLKKINRGYCSLNGLVWPCPQWVVSNVLCPMGKVMCEVSTPLENWNATSTSTHRKTWSMKFLQHLTYQLLQLHKKNLLICRLQPQTSCATP